MLFAAEWAKEIHQNTERRKQTHMFNVWQAQDRTCTKLLMRRKKICRRSSLTNCFLGQVSVLLFSLRTNGPVYLSVQLVTRRDMCKVRTDRISGIQKNSSPRGLIVAAASSFQIAPFL